MTAAALRRDDGGIVTGWLLKLVLTLALFAVVAFEAGAVVIARVQADGIAVDAAREAGAEYFRTDSVEKARDAAEAVALRRNAEVVSFAVAEDRQSVSVTIEKRARTTFIQAIDPLERFATARVTHRGQVR